MVTIMALCGIIALFIYAIAHKKLPSARNAWLLAFKTNYGITFGLKLGVSPWNFPILFS